MKKYLYKRELSYPHLTPSFMIILIDIRFGFPTYKQIKLIIYFKDKEIPPQSTPIRFWNRIKWIYQTKSDAIIFVSGKEECAFLSESLFNPRTGNS